MVAKNPSLWPWAGPEPASSWTQSLHANHSATSSPVILITWTSGNYQASCKWQMFLLWYVKWSEEFQCCDWLPSLPIDKTVWTWPFVVLKGELCKERTALCYVPFARAQEKYFFFFFKSGRQNNIILHADNFNGNIAEKKASFSLYVLQKEAVVGRPWRLFIHAVLLLSWFKDDQKQASSDTWSILIY